MAHVVSVDFDETQKQIRLTCGCGWVAHAPNIDASQAAAINHRVHGFFANFAAEARKPHFGDMQRDWNKALLTRATEAGLYDPSKEPT